MVAPRCHTVSHAMAVGLRGVRAPGRFVRPQGRGGLGCQVQNEGGVCKLLQDRQCTAHPAEGKAEGPNRVSPRVPRRCRPRMDVCAGEGSQAACAREFVRAGGSTRRAHHVPAVTMARAAKPGGNRTRCETGPQKTQASLGRASSAALMNACRLVAMGRSCLAVPGRRPWPSWIGPT